MPSEHDERARRAAQALARAKEDARARGQRPPGQRGAPSSWTDEPGAAQRSERAGKDDGSRRPGGSKEQSPGVPEGQKSTAPDARKRRVRRVSRTRREDPEPLAAAVDGLLSEQGWRLAVAAGAVFGRWDQIVGAELAAHTRPERFSDGELVVSADSTAWATQVRLLAGTLVRRVNEELGNGMVKRVKVHGPAGPRRMGPLRVRGGRGTNGDYG